MICGKIVETIRFYFNALFLTIVWTIRNVTSTGNSDSLACLVGKTAIITGGNGGIGYATSVLLASRGCKVIIACRSDGSAVRDKISEITGNPNIITRKLNLASLKSVRTFADDIKKTEDKIDILINNAGVGALSEKVTEDGLNAVMQTNYYGAFLLTHLLIEPLRASINARVIFLTSGFAYCRQPHPDELNMTNYKSDGWMSLILYSNSKFCGLLAAQEFAKRLRKYNIVVNAADSGPARTDIHKKAYEACNDWVMELYYRVINFVSRDKFDAAQTSFHLASSEKLKKESGQIYFRCKSFPKPFVLKDQDFCDKIWKKTEELVQLGPTEKL